MKRILITFSSLSITLHAADSTPTSSNPSPAVTASPAQKPHSTGIQLPDSSPDLSKTADGLWHVNDMKRPMPEKVTPKPEAELAASAQPPANAIILFNGKDLSAWKPSEWKVENGYVEITKSSTKGRPYLTTKQAFGSCRLHLEWTTPNPPTGTLQMRGNSGVFLMGNYEIQVLDSYDNPTYADGIAGAVYGQTPPSVNPIRPSGEWQYYDIEFHRPIFADGKLIKPATVTVDFNGIRVQDHTIVQGSTGPGHRGGYHPHADALPLQLQDHGCPDRFRNIWIVPLQD